MIIKIEIKPEFLNDGDPNEHWINLALVESSCIVPAHVSIIGDDKREIPAVVQFTTSSGQQLVFGKDEIKLIEPVLGLIGFVNPMMEKLQ